MPVNLLQETLNKINDLTQSQQEYHNELMSAIRAISLPMMQATAAPAGEGGGGVVDAKAGRGVGGGVVDAQAGLGVGSRRKRSKSKRKSKRKSKKKSKKKSKRR